MSRRPTSRPAGERRAVLVVGRVLVAATVAAGGLAACTSTEAPSVSGTHGVRAPTPAPALTPVDTVRCVVQGTLPADQDVLPAYLLWRPGGGVVGSTERPLETIPGPDAARCPDDLPTAGCEPPPPWAEPSTERFFTASGASRRVEGESSWSIQHPAPTGVQNLQSARYGVVVLRVGDPRGARAYLERAMRQCARATPMTIGARTVLVGIGPSEFRQGPATVVLLTGSDAVAWLTLDGTTQISTAEMNRIVGVAATRLLPP